MPTKSYEPLLNRELRKVEAKEIIDIASPLLKEQINYATNVFIKCLDSATQGVPAVHVAVFSLYHHVIEMVDGIEVLVSQGCAVSTIPLLRSTFEAMLGIQYILENDYEQRAYSWAVCLFQNMKSKYIRIGKKKKLEDNIESEPKIPNGYQCTESTHIPSILEMLQSLDLLLDHKNMKPINDEYKRLKKGSFGKPNWFSLFGGPQNIEELAKRFRRSKEYDNLYRKWANISHGVDLSNYLNEYDGKKLIFYPIRNNNELNALSILASTFLSIATSKMIEKFRINEVSYLESWHIQECRPMLYKLIKSLQSTR